MNRGRGGYGAGGGGYGRGGGYGGGGYGRGGGSYRGGGRGAFRGGGRFGSGSGGGGAGGNGSGFYVDNMGRAIGGGGGGYNNSNGAGTGRIGTLRAKREEEEAFDTKMGFQRLDLAVHGSETRLGWLCNMLPTTITSGSGSSGDGDEGGSGGGGGGGGGQDLSALDLYLLQQDGSTFKATVAYEPYFYVAVAASASGGGGGDDGEGGAMGGRTREVISCLERRFEGLLSSVTAVEKEDLEMPNHLSGKKREYLKLSFRSSSELQTVKSNLRPIVEKNQQALQRSREELSGGVAVDDEASSSSSSSLMALDTAGAASIVGGVASLLTAGTGAAGGASSSAAAAGEDPLSLLIDLREHDVPFYQRCSIDLDIRVGCWYSVTPIASNPGVCRVVREKELMMAAEPRILAFDIETTKAPLMFPNASFDCIYMLSMVMGEPGGNSSNPQGVLLINREVVGGDVPDFEYSPSKDYKGPFVVHNLANERALIRFFFDLVQSYKPQIFVTYNGDFFDWPFVEARAKVHGLSMRKEIGIYNVAAPDYGPNSGASSGPGQAGSEYRGRVSVHQDCLYWVKRDSYLPQGSHGLKAVTKAKLGYDPVEIDPEDMLSLAQSQPLMMASYSVSDAVATYYLYQKYIHSFVFSLATIIPLGPDDVLRKGSGTLCESLLMVEAYKGNIICPNKQQDKLGRTYHGHYLDSETYLGGHVECLESGVFRHDLPTNWKLVPKAFDELIAKIDRALTFAIEVEADVQLSSITNYYEVRAAIIEKLELLRDRPVRTEKPVIYHLDVAAMYPNIILTNRLQPQAMVEGGAKGAMCSGCEFNTPPPPGAHDPSGEGLSTNLCQRKMHWRWRGEYFPATREETEAVRQQLEGEVIDGVAFADMPLPQQDSILKARLKGYSSTVYKRQKDTIETDKAAYICQRENPFYVNTVKAFRDRRYEYKGLTKMAAKKVSDAEKAGNLLAAEEARNLHTLYDSLQLAHKCILNSFYGYVMRKGARWHSMEMAGVVTYTGSKLIQQARILVEQVGRPLEIDTDGIWCILPSSFPQNFAFMTKEGKKIPISYPCVMLNADVHDNYTNHQYQELIDPVTRSYKITSECSIFFELDGPWGAMVLPASQEEGKLLKKRYAVFGRDGSLSELKGFELKRRGELKMIKVFQSQVFDRFFEGNTLEGCYNAVGEVANYWLNVLDTQGEDLDDADLIDFLSENRSLTRQVDEYGEQKSVALSTAKRLAEFLGGDMVKDKGLSCKLLVARKPAGAPVTERAIPTTIFEAEPDVMRHYLRKWLKDSSMSEVDGDFNIRAILDWDYYRTRLAKAIQKIITIPAGLQGITNPVPRVAHPDWLNREVAARSETAKQTSLNAYFTTVAAGAGAGGGKAGARSAKAKAALTNGGAASASASASATGEGGAGAGDLEDLAKKLPLPASSPSTSKKAKVGDEGLPKTVIHIAPPLPLPILGLNPAPAAPAPLPASAEASSSDGSAAAPSPNGPASPASETGTASPATVVSPGDLAAASNADGASPSSPTDLVPASSSSSSSASSSTVVSSWLASRKALWKADRDDKKRKRSEMSGEDGNNKNKKGSGAWSLKGLRKEALSLQAKDSRFGSSGLSSAAGSLNAASSAYLHASMAASGYWQIVEIRETPSSSSSSSSSSHGSGPGFFQVFAFTSSKRLQSFIIEVPRKLLVNRFTPALPGSFLSNNGHLLHAPAGAAAAAAAAALEGSGNGSSTVFLPHDATPYWLYELDISEKKFSQRQETILREFDVDPSVVALYQTESPLGLNALSRIGCVAKLLPGTTGQSLRNVTGPGQGQRSLSSSAATNKSGALTAASKAKQPAKKLHQPKLSFGNIGGAGAGAAKGKESAPSVEDDAALLMFDEEPAPEADTGEKQGAEVAMAADEEQQPTVADADASINASTARKEEDVNEVEMADAHAQASSAVSAAAGSPSAPNANAAAATGGNNSKKTTSKPVGIAASAVTFSRGRKGVHGAQQNLDQLFAAQNQQQQQVYMEELDEAAHRYQQQQQGARNGRGLSASAASSSSALAAAVASSSSSSTVQQLYHVADLDNLSTSTNPYLTPETACYRVAYLYHAANIGLQSSLKGIDFSDVASTATTNKSASNRSVTILFIIKQTTTALAQICYDRLVSQWTEQALMKVQQQQQQQELQRQRAQQQDDGEEGGNQQQREEPQHFQLGIDLDDTTRHRLMSTASALAETLGANSELGVDVTAHVFIVGASNTASSSGSNAGGSGLQAQVPIPSIKAIFNETVSRLRYSKDNGLDQRTRSMHVASQRDVWRKVSGLLNDASPSSGGGGMSKPPLIVLATSYLPTAALVNAVSALHHLPVLRLPYHKEDVAFPPQRWMTAGLQRACVNFFFSLQWWRTRLEASRYAQIPVANLGSIEAASMTVNAGASPSALYDPDPTPLLPQEEEMTALASQLREQLSLTLYQQQQQQGTTMMMIDDLQQQRMIEERINQALALRAQEKVRAIALSDVRLTTTMADIYFARMLNFNKHVLWASSSSLPDLGLGLSSSSSAGAAAGGGSGSDGAALSILPAMIASRSVALAAVLPGLGISMGSGTGPVIGVATGSMTGAGGAFKGAAAVAGASGTAGGAADSAAAAASALSAAAATSADYTDGMPQALPDGFLSLSLVSHANSILGGLGGAAAVGNGGWVADPALANPVASNPNPIVVRPGLYRCVCAYLGLRDLAVAAVLGSQYLKIGAMMGGGLNDLPPVPGTEDAGASSSSGGGTVFAAFRTLKKLLTNWVVDKQANRALADIMLSRFYAWLASPSSAHHDPALHAFVHSLMARTFKALLGSLRAAGLFVVYASFDALVIATGKRSLAHAETMIFGGLEKIRAQPLFSHLQIAPQGVYQSLLFVNQHNFAGVQVDVLKAANIAEEVARSRTLVGDTLAEAFMRVSQGLPEGATSAKSRRNRRRGGSSDDEEAELEDERLEEEIRRYEEAVQVLDSYGGVDGPAFTLDDAVTALVCGNSGLSASMQEASSSSSGAQPQQQQHQQQPGQGGFIMDLDHAWSQRVLREACMSIGLDQDLAHALAVVYPSPSSPAAATAAAVLAKAAERKEKEKAKAQAKKAAKAAKRQQQSRASPSKKAGTPKKPKKQPREAAEGDDDEFVDPDAQDEEEDEENEEDDNSDERSAASEEINLVDEEQDEEEDEDDDDEAPLDADAQAILDAKEKVDSSLVSWKVLEKRYIEEAISSLNVDKRFVVADYLPSSGLSGAVGEEALEVAASSLNPGAAFLDVAVGLYLLKPFKTAAKRIFARFKKRFLNLVLPAMGFTGPFLHTILQNSAIAMHPSHGLSASSASSGADTSYLSSFNQHHSQSDIEGTGTADEDGLSGIGGGKKNGKGAKRRMRKRSLDAGNSVDNSDNSSLYSSDGDDDGISSRDSRSLASSSRGGHGLGVAGNSDDEVEFQEGNISTSNSNADSSPAQLTKQKLSAQTPGAANSKEQVSPAFTASPAELGRSQQIVSASSLPISLPDLAAVLRRQMTKEEEAQENSEEVRVIKEMFASQIADKFLTMVSDMEKGAAAAASAASAAHHNASKLNGAATRPSSSAVAAAGGKYPIDRCVFDFFRVPLNGGGHGSLAYEEAARELSILLHMRGSKANAAASAASSSLSSSGALVKTSPTKAKDDEDSNADGDEEEDDEDGLPKIDADAVVRQARRVASAVAFPRYHTLNSSRAALPFVSVATSLLALDPLVAPEVGTLRSTALAILGVGDFSSQANLRDATATVVVPDIVCRSCSAVRDVDLARERCSTGHMAVISKPHVSLQPLDDAEAQEQIAEIQAGIEDRLHAWKARQIQRYLVATYKEQRRLKRQQAKEKAAAKKAAKKARRANLDAAAANEEDMLAEEEHYSDDEEAEYYSGQDEEEEDEETLRIDALQDFDEDEPIADDDDTLALAIAHHNKMADAAFMLTEMKKHYRNEQLSERKLVLREADSALCRPKTVFTHTFHWRCLSCGHHYDSADVESTLVAAVEARSLAYQLQDLACCRCGRVRSSPVRTYCECSGRFTAVIPALAFRSYLRVLQGVALAFGFHWLLDTVETMLMADGAL